MNSFPTTAGHTVQGESGKYDNGRGTVMIIGAGPAGVAAAAMLASLDVPFRWFSKPSEQPNVTGGMLWRVYNQVVNYPPFWGTGPDLAEAFSSFIGNFPYQPEPCEVLEVTQDRGQFLVEVTKDSTSYTEGATRTDVTQISSYTTIAVDAVILATGTKYQQLGVPGEPRRGTPLGTDVSWYHQSASHCDATMSECDILVVGGGDAAFENALKLAQLNANVDLAVRSNFAARQSWINQAIASSRINILPIPTHVVAFEPIPDIRPPAIPKVRAILSDMTSHPPKIVEKTYDHCFVRIGVCPVAPLLPESVKTDANGFIEVARDGSTSQPGLFAIGDVTNTNVRSIASSVGDAAKAARATAEYLGYFT